MKIDDFYDDLEPTITEKGDNEQVTIPESSGMTEDEPTRVIKKDTTAFAWIVCLSRKCNGQKFDVREGVTSIGRSDSNDIVVDDDSVSKEHTKIKYLSKEDSYKIYDLVSTNGTFVNDVSVEAPIELKDGDTITIGEVEFVFKRIKKRKLKKRRFIKE